MRVVTDVDAVTIGSCLDACYSSVNVGLRLAILDLAAASPRSHSNRLCRGTIARLRHAIIPIWIGIRQRITANVGIQIETLRILLVGKRHRIRVVIVAHIRRHKPAHAGSVVPCPEVVVS